MASSKTCERYIFEKEILTLKTKERITFREAKEIVQERYGPRFKTFSSVLRNSDLNGNKEIPTPHSVGANLNKSKKLSYSSKPLQTESMEITTFNKRTRSQDSFELPSKLTKGQVEDSSGSVVEFTADPLASSGELPDNISAPPKRPNLSDSSPPETCDLDTPTVSKESASSSQDPSRGSLPPSLPDLESGEYKELGALSKAPRDKKNSPHPNKHNGKPKGGTSRKALNRESPSIKRK